MLNCNINCWNNVYRVPEKVCDKQGVLTLKEGDLQLGRLRGILGRGRATDGVDGTISAKRDAQ